MKYLAFLCVSDGSKADAWAADFDKRLDWLPLEGLGVLGSDYGVRFYKNYVIVRSDCETRVRQGDRCAYAEQVAP